MFGPFVDRSWARGKRPGLAKHVAAARAALAEPKAPFAFQVFVAGPRHMRFTVEMPEARELRAYIRDQNAAGAPTWGVAHGTYMDVPWDAAKASHKYTLRWIRCEMLRAASAGLAGLVIHLGATPPDRVVSVLPGLLFSSQVARGEQPPRPVADVVRAGGEKPPDFPFTVEAGDLDGLQFWHCYARGDASRRPAGPGAHAPDCVRLYLEVPAVLPKNSHYESPAKLRYLFAEIRRWADPDLRHFGLCIDTAHIWASGADIGSYDAAAAWLRELEACHDVIPPHAIMFHLNDNRHGRGSGRDHHAVLLAGQIWGDYADRPDKSGLAAFVDYAQRFGIPTVLERNAGKGDKGGLLAALQADYATLRRKGVSI